LIWERGASLTWLSLPPFSKKKITLFVSTLRGIALLSPPVRTPLLLLYSEEEDDDGDERRQQRRGMRTYTTIK
jgi:hypothetical protein